MAEAHTNQEAEAEPTDTQQHAAHKQAETEAEMRAKMIAQHRAMRCVGCGEGEEFF